MKRHIAIILGTVLIGTACENQKSTTTDKNIIIQGEVQDSIPQEYKLSKEQAGFAKVDMSIQELNTYYNKTKIKQSSFNQEGQKYQAYFVNDKNDKAALRIEPVCNKECKIWRIEVLSPDYKTATGLGIGSTVADIKKYHYIDWADKTEEGLGVRVERFGLTFLLDSTTVPNQNLTKETLPDSGKVKAVMITKSNTK